MTNGKQLDHTDYISEVHEKEIVILAVNFMSPENYGMLIRTAEAIGVKKIFFISEIHQSLNSKMLRSSRSAEKNLEIAFVQNGIKVLSELRLNGFEVIALEHTTDSIPLTEFNPGSKKIALIAGNERYGVSEEFLNLSNRVIHIPMYGINSSMNVVMATGIALFYLINR